MAAALSVPRLLSLDASTEESEDSAGPAEICQIHNAGEFATTEPTIEAAGEPKTTTQGQRSNSKATDSTDEMKEEIKSVKVETKMMKDHINAIKDIGRQVEKRSELSSIGVYAFRRRNKE
ncbi:MAG: hypothetical protein L6R37_006265 [Teloschistes peruensis]|nr:MAG: hypothetical protein L6R37_006265 [Teloschistes peruensis]